MKKCTECGGRAHITETRRKGDSVRRRFRCKSCRFAWTEWNGPQPERESRGKPDEAVIRDILTSADKDSALARRHRMARSMIYRIKHGMIYANYATDIKRFANEPMTCEQCQHWQPERMMPCDLDLPDPQEEGIGFARWCVTFKEASA